MSKIGEYSRQKLDKIIEDKSVAGPETSTDNAIARFDGTGGKTIQNSGCIIDDSDNMEIAGNLSVDDDKKIIFGTDDDAHIEYNEDEDDNLVISGSATGVVLSGAMLSFDPTTVDSGSIAGPGSYLGVTSTGQVVLTASSGGEGGSPGGSDTQIQYNNGDEFGGVASLTFNDSDGHLTIIDDKKLQFGSNADASIEYDEDNTNKLIISGSTGGFDIDLPDNVASAFEISEEANPYMTFITTNSSEGVKFSQDIVLVDDKKMWFGSDEDASIEYDEDGGNFLAISGSSEGVVLSGSIIKLDGTHTGHANIWTPPLDPHAQDDEFDSTTFNSDYEAYQIGSPAGAGSIITDAVDPYTNFTTDKTIKVNTHTTNRPSWALMQPRNVDKEICLAKAYTFPTNVLIYARMSFQVAVTVSNNDASFALIFGGDDGSGNVDPGDQLRIYSNESDGGVTQCEYAKYDNSSWSSVASYPSSATGHPSTMQYFALHKVGSNYYGWIGTEGHWVYMGTTTLSFTPAHVGFLFHQRAQNPLSVFGCDFIRFIETAVFPFC